MLATVLSLVAYQPQGRAPVVVGGLSATSRSTSELRMMAKPKKDTRSWLPQRTSKYAREQDVALMLVSRAAAAMAQPLPIANLVTQALVSDGLASEFPGDTLIAGASHNDGRARAVHARDPPGNSARPIRGANGHLIEFSIGVLANEAGR